jgi:nitroreductase
MTEIRVREFPRGDAPAPVSEEILEEILRDAGLESLDHPAEPDRAA